MATTTRIASAAASPPRPASIASSSAVNARCVRARPSRPAQEPKGVPQVAAHQVLGGGGLTPWPPVPTKSGARGQSPPAPSAPPAAAGPTAASATAATTRFPPRRVLLASASMPRWKSRSAARCAARSQAAAACSICRHTRRSRLRSARVAQLGSRRLVGDEQVALTGAGGTAGDGAAVHHCDRQPGRRALQRAGGADHAPGDDHDVDGGHGLSMSGRPFGMRRSGARSVGE
jgi:hypothetical protein